MWAAKQFLIVILTEFFKTKQWDMYLPQSLEFDS